LLLQTTGCLPEVEKSLCPPADQDYILNGQSLQATNLWLAEGQQFPEVGAKAILIFKPNC